MIRLGLALLLTLFASQSSRPTSRPVEPRTGPQPADFSQLEPPSRSRRDATKEVPPQDGTIGRNQGVGGRFLEEGTDVEYRFESKKGEVSLFMLSTWGFSRGWQSTAEIRVLDEAGFVLASRSRHGGTRYQVFLAFEAPRDGEFRCQLRAAKEHYRYTLARHSDFTPEFGSRAAIGTQEQSYGFVADAGKRVIFELELEAGRETSVEVVNAAPRTRRIAAQKRSSQLGTGAIGQSPAMRKTPIMDSGSDQDWPALALRVIGQVEPLERSPHYLRFTPEKTGVYQVEVFCRNQGDGGIFELLIDRDLDVHAVSGHVADKQARARGEVELRFYREPDLGLAATAKSDAKGNFTAAVPDGAYTITMHREGFASKSLRTNILSDRELNTIYATNSIAPTSRLTKD